MEKKKVKLKIKHLRLDLTTPWGKRLQQISDANGWKVQFTAQELIKKQIELMDGQK